MSTDSVDAGLVYIPALTCRGGAVDCHLPMTNVYRDRLENGLAGLYWGLEGRLRRFLDVYMTDKEKPRLRGCVV